MCRLYQAEWEALDATAARPGGGGGTGGYWDNCGRKRWKMAINWGKAKGNEMRDEEEEGTRET